MKNPALMGFSMRGKDLMVGKNDQGFTECVLPLPVKLWAPHLTVSWRSCIRLKIGIHYSRMKECWHFQRITELWAGGVAHKLNFFSPFTFPRQFHGTYKPGTMIDCQGLYSSRCCIGSATAEQQPLGVLYFWSILTLLSILHWYRGKQTCGTGYP